MPMTGVSKLPPHRHAAKELRPAPAEQHLLACHRQEAGQDAFFEASAQNNGVVLLIHGQRERSTSSQLPGFAASRLHSTTNTSIASTLLLY